MVMRLYGWEPLTVSYQTGSFGGLRYSDSKDKMFGCVA